MRATDAIGIRELDRRCAHRPKLSIAVPGSDRFSELAAVGGQRQERVGSVSMVASGSSAGPWAKSIFPFGHLSADAVLAEAQLVGRVDAVGAVRVESVLR